MEQEEVDAGGSPKVKADSPHQLAHNGNGSHVYGGGLQNGSPPEKNVTLGLGNIGAFDVELDDLNTGKKDTTEGTYVTMYGTNQNKIPVPYS